MALDWWNQLTRFGSARAAVDATGRSVTYRELADLADQCVASIPRRTLVVIECDNSIGCLVAYIGCLRNGIVPLLLDAKLELNLREALYANYHVAYVLSSESTGTDDWRSTGSTSPALFSGLAILLSTSGSTGSPRLVRLSLENLASNADSISTYLGLTQGEKPIAHLPMSYSYGLSIINSHLLVGACLLLTNSGVAERNFWDTFKAHGATSLAGVPATYEQLTRIRFERMSLPTLKLMTQAGGRMSPELVTRFSNHMTNNGGRFFVMYGQTEATARIAYLDHQSTADRAGSIGKAIPGGRLFLRDESLREIEDPDVVGEICYEGSNVMLGYAVNADDLAKGDEQHGVLATGDLGKRDQDGFYYVTGRLKRFIKINGNRMGLDEVEAFLQRQQFDVAVTGRDDQLCIAIRGSDPAMATEVKQSVINQYHLHHSSLGVCLCADLPYTTSGKLDYPKILNEFVFS